MKYISFFAVVLSALLIAVLGAPPHLNASPAAPTPVPMGHPDFSSMRFLMGTWTCHQTLRGKDRSDTSATTMALDGQYMLTHDNAPSFDKYRTRAVKTESYTTYNSRTHQWVTISVDNFGGYGMSTSSGWNGNTMSSRTIISQDGSTGSDISTKVSDSKTIDKSINRSPDGTVTKSTIVCTKAP